MPMRIAILSDPNNFHTRKWAKSLIGQGAEVIVFSFDQAKHQEFPAYRLKPPVGKGKSYSYLDYLRGGKVLATALQEHRIDLLNPLNVTPFGVWARQSGFHPCIVSALGSDILEYPPKHLHSNELYHRSWDNPQGKQNFLKRSRLRFKKSFFRKRVAEALSYADLLTGDNQHLVDAMKNWFGTAPEKMKVLRWGIEEELFKASEAEMDELRSFFGIPAGKRVILSPRGANALYQGDIIVDALGRLLEKGLPDHHVIMLGAGYAVSDEVAFKAEALAKRFPSFTFRKDMLPREMIYQLWNLVDAFISAPIYDGYSAVVAEGRYIGAIPIVNNIPGNREIIVHGVNGWITEPFNAERLFHDLSAILGNISETKAKFAAINRKWILENSLVDRNAALFTEWGHSLLTNRT